MRGYSILPVLTLALAPQTAWASEFVELPRAFDLLRDCPSAEDAIVVRAVAGAGAPLPVPTWQEDFHGLTRKEELRPRFSQELLREGPVFHFATFGLGKQHKRPKIAHVAIDWSF